MAEKVVIQIDLDAGTVDSSFGKIEQSSKKTGNSIASNLGGGLTKVASSVAKIGTALASIAIGATFAKGVQAAIAQEDAVNRLNGALRSAGDFSVQASNDLASYASELQKTTKFGDEEILNQLALAKSFGATNEQAKEIAKTATDLSAAFGIDLESATRNVAKTLGGLSGELGETIPQLKSLTQEQLKAGEGIDLIASKFAGQATNATKTFSGALAQTSNAFGDTLERIGELVTKSPFVIKIIKELGVLFNRAGDGIKSFGENLNIFDSVIQPLFSFNRAIIDFVITPLELGLNVAKLFFNGFATGFNAILSGLGTVAGKLNEFLGFFGVDSGLTQQIQTFNDTVKESFLKSAQDTQDSLNGIGDTSLSENLAIKNEELLIQLKAFNEELAIEADKTKTINEETIASTTATAQESSVSLLDFFGSIVDGIGVTAKAGANAAIQIAGIVQNTLVKAISGGIQNVIKSLLSGQDAFGNFTKFVLGTFGDMAIQMGNVLILQGIAIESLKALNGAAAIAAGIGLVALGTILKSFAGSGGGGGATTGSATSGDGGSFGGFGGAEQSQFAQSGVADQEQERAAAGTIVNFSVQGDVLQTEDTGRNIAQLLSDSIDKEGVVIKGLSFA